MKFDNPKRFSVGDLVEWKRPNWRTNPSIDWLGVVYHTAESDRYSDGEWQKAWVHWSDGSTRVLYSRHSTWNYVNCVGVSNATS